MTTRKRTRGGTWSATTSTAISEWRGWRQRSKASRRGGGEAKGARRPERERRKEKQKKKEAQRIERERKEEEERRRREPEEEAREKAELDMERLRWNDAMKQERRALRGQSLAVFIDHPVTKTNGVHASSICKVLRKRWKLIQ